jgi:hypothetical protein
MNTWSLWGPGKGGETTPGPPPPSSGQTACAISPCLQQRTKNMQFTTLNQQRNTYELALQILILYINKLHKFLSKKYLFVTGQIPTLVNKSKSLS